MADMEKDASLDSFETREQLLPTKHPALAIEEDEQSKERFRTPTTRTTVVTVFVILLLILYPFSSYHRRPQGFRNASMQSGSSSYLLGLGIGDITGPVVEINMMGYADSKQLGTGLHMRLRSRAFIVADPEGANRWVLINADICMGDSAVRKGVVEKLSELYPGVYTDRNVAIVGTHSHSGIAGFLHNVLPQITSRGFVPQNYDAIVNGTVLAVQRAHETLTPGSLDLGATTLLDSNINRSPFAYMANPAEERDRYTYDIDKDLKLVRFSSRSGKPRGFMSFFPVHGTSIYINNTLISGDNKGMAAYLAESHAEPNVAPGQTTFVAGFFQSSVGDTSPNTLGAYCETGKDKGKPCAYENSTCNGVAAGCQGRGPGFLISDYESNRIIGYNQFQAARGLVEGDSLSSLSGAVRAVHIYVDMSNYTFTLANGTSVSTCPPALGYGFAGGTTDGAGYYDFTQNRNGTEHNPFWRVVKSAIGGPPSAEQARCHSPKPILMNTGYARRPYDWSPAIVDIQMFRAGQLVILVVPAEFTTMAGRRLVEAVRSELISSGILGEEARVILTGPANTYSHYTATREEYSIQRYEGASTIYGPFSLEAYTDIYTGLVPYLSDNATKQPPPGPTPPDFRSQAISLQNGVIADRAPFRKTFGAVLKDVESLYHRGETVSVVFQGANPRNNLRLEGTFLVVEQRMPRNVWKVIRTDSHPSTVLHWARTSTILGTSTVNITWTIEPETPSGRYRIRYFGDAKPFRGNVQPFKGVSSVFTFRNT